MSRRPRLGDLALACAVLVLAASAYADLHTSAQKRQAGLAAFARDAAGKPGLLSDPVYRRAYRVAAVCALHRPAAGALADFRLCGIIRRTDSYVFVGRFYRCRLGTRCVPTTRVKARKGT